MTINWTSSDLASGLDPYPLLTTDSVQRAYNELQAENADVSLLFVRLDDLTLYVRSWDLDAGVWLVVAVVKMIHEILSEYELVAGKSPLMGGDPTQEIILVIPLESEQDIVHRLWTAYQELYNILARTQRKAGNRYWHRRATVNNFPQLMIEVEDSDSANDE